MIPAKPSIGHIISLAGKLSLEELDSLIKVLTAYRDNALVVADHFKKDKP
jgi:hypothetical protein